MNEIRQDRRRALLALASTLPLGALSWPGRAAAQDGYPSKPVTIVLPYAPGGSTDIVARVAANYLGPIVHGTFLVDNRPGASGTIAMGTVARAAPDGYTLYMTEMTSTIVGALVPKLPFDPDTAFTPIAMIAETPYVLVVNNNVPVRTLKEFIAYASERPGKLNYGSGGVGSGPHIAGELFKSIAKLDIRHVPYKGSGPALQDLMGGQIEMLITAAPTVAQMAGKVRPLAVAKEKRISQLPDVPSAVEAGLPSFVVSNWFGLSAPRGTPEQVVKTLDAAVAEMLRRPEAVNKLVAAGGEPMYMGPADAQKKITAETQRWSALIHEAGIKNDN
jgi:tripartite-type tricarboxylate transporter receptor subunit TctC